MSTLIQGISQTGQSRFLTRFRSNPFAIPSVLMILVFVVIAVGTALLSSFGHQWPCDPNLTNLEQLVGAKSFTIAALPLKTETDSALARVVAIID